MAEVEMIGGITDSVNMSASKLWEIVKDRGAWCAVVHGVTKSWTRLRGRAMTVTRDSAPRLWALKTKCRVTHQRRKQGRLRSHAYVCHTPHPPTDRLSAPPALHSLRLTQPTHGPLHCRHIPSTPRQPAHSYSRLSPAQMHTAPCHFLHAPGGHWHWGSV